MAWARYSDPRRELVEDTFIMVPEDLVGLIIGRGGSQIKKIQEETNCRINILNAEISEIGENLYKKCTLVGTSDAVKEAKEAIKAVLERSRPNVQCVYIEEIATLIDEDQISEESSSEDDWSNWSYQGNAEENWFYQEDWIDLSEPPCPSLRGPRQTRSYASALLRQNLSDQSQMPNCEIQDTTAENKETKSSMKSDLKSWEEDIEQHLSCSVCYELFKDPRVFKCGHSFCLQCIVKYAGGGQRINCPECRKEVDLGTFGIKDLPKNFRLGDAAERLRKSETKETGGLPKCGSHNRDLEVYCKSCDILMCVDCTSSTHDGHKIGNINRKYEVVKESLQKIDQDIRKAKQEAEREMKSNRNLIDDTKKKQKNAVELVDSVFTQLGETLATKRLELVTEIVKGTSTLIDTYENRRAKIGQILGRLDEIENLNTKILTQSKSYVIHESSSLQKGLQAKLLEVGTALESDAVLHDTFVAPSVCIGWTAEVIPSIHLHWGEEEECLQKFESPQQMYNDLCEAKKSADDLHEQFVQLKHRLRTTEQRRVELEELLEKEQAENERLQRERQTYQRRIELNKLPGQSTKSMAPVTFVSPEDHEKSSDEEDRGPETMKDAGEKKTYESKFAKEVEENNFLCSTCKKTFQSKPALKRHRKKHARSETKAWSGVWS